MNYKNAKRRPERSALLRSGRFRVPSVFGGTLAGQFFEGHGKLRDIGESAGGGDVRDTDGGIAQ